mgnify:CR=1 FL=1
MGTREESVAGQAAAKAGTGDDFYAEMEAARVTPLWDRYNDLVAPEPTPRDPGTLWRWTDLLPLIERASNEVVMEEAERRVLMLLNPIFDGQPMTTTGLFGAVQTLLPGEHARPHRHSATAFRFVMEGTGAKTVVNGKDCPMEVGDVILTPNWTWHEHVNNGDMRVCWYDGLDLPISVFYNAIFAEHGHTGNFPPDASTVPDGTYATAGLTAQNDSAPVRYSPMFRYPWKGVLEALSHMAPGDDGTRRLRYTDPTDGGPALPTMDLYVLDLPQGAETRAARTTSNAICVVAEGEGTSRVGEQEIAWTKNDIFTLPHWTWVSHKAASENARLFLNTDREVLKRLNLLRDEQAD